MFETPQNKEYYTFLQWFQNNHPTMYAKYWKNITIPKEGERVDVSGTNIDAKDFDKLLQIEYDYYTLEQNSSDK